jgi:hypothetical protein
MGDLFPQLLYRSVPLLVPLELTFELVFTHSSRKPRSVSVYFQQIVNGAEKQPLRVDLAFPPHTESIKPHRCPNIGKYRFRSAKPPVVDETTFDRINLSFHLRREGLRSLF